MAMTICEEDNTLRFDIPNSEASIEAQHNGIKDRTVGQYYMSDNFGGCSELFSDFDGEFYLDILLSITKAKKIIDLLHTKNFDGAFKDKLVPQINQLQAFEWMLSQSEDCFHRFKAPTVNDQQKYLKLDPEDSIITAFKTLLLGDLCSAIFKCIERKWIHYVSR